MTHLQSPDIQLANQLPLYDLVIASKKYGFGQTDSADAPILWWKLPGQPKEAPPCSCSLVDPAIQNRLLNYDLVDTEVQRGQIVRKYRRKETTSE